MIIKFCVCLLAFGDHGLREINCRVDLWLEHVQSSLLIRIVRRQMAQHVLVLRDGVPCARVVRKERVLPAHGISPRALVSISITCLEVSSIRFIMV